MEIESDCKAQWINNFIHELLACFSSRMCAMCLCVCVYTKSELKHVPKSVETGRRRRQKINTNLVQVRESKNINKSILYDNMSNYLKYKNGTWTTLTQHGGKKQHSHTVRRTYARTNYLVLHSWRCVCLHVGYVYAISPKRGYYLCVCISLEIGTDPWFVFCFCFLLALLYLQFFFQP